MNLKKENNSQLDDELMELEQTLSLSVITGGDERDIYIYTEITRVLAESIVSTIRDINKSDDEEELLNKGYKRKPINIFIDTYGGEVSAGFSTITAIKRSKTPVNGIVTGNCCSMGVPILLSCDNRYSTSFSMFMIHSISVESISGSSVAEYKNQLEPLEIHQKILANFFNSEVEGQEEFYSNIVDNQKDYFFDAQEALDRGIIDCIGYELFESNEDNQIKHLEEKSTRKWKSKATK